MFELCEAFSAPEKHAQVPRTQATEVFACKFPFYSQQFLVLRCCAKHKSILMIFATRNILRYSPLSRNDHVFRSTTICDLHDLSHLFISLSSSHLTVA